MCSCDATPECNTTMRPGRFHRGRYGTSKNNMVITKTTKLDCTKQQIDNCKQYFTYCMCPVLQLSNTAQMVDSLYCHARYLYEKKKKKCMTGRPSQTIFTAPSGYPCPPSDLRRFLRRRGRTLDLHHRRLLRGRTLPNPRAERSHPGRSNTRKATIRGCG